MVYDFCARAVIVRQPVLMTVVFPTNQTETGTDIPTVVSEETTFRQIIDVLTAPDYVVLRLAGHFGDVCVLNTIYTADS